MTPRTKHRPVISAAPCAKCPFRKDVPIYLRSGRRAEIARSLIEGADFHCHQTVTWNEDEDGGEISDLSDAVICAGAAKALMQSGGTTNTMRVAERIGLADLDKTERVGADCWSLSEWQRLAEGATADNAELEEDEEIPTCCVVNDGCLASAGYLGSDGGVLEGIEPADLICDGCGEPVCSNCANDDGYCAYCAEVEKEDD